MPFNDSDFQKQKLGEILINIWGLKKVVKKKLEKNRLCKTKMKQDAEINITL